MDDFEIKKPCIICKETKPISDYHKHPKMADGHINKCKKCAIAYALRYNAEHPHATKANHKKWTLSEKGKRKIKELMWKFPDREYARRAVKKALKDGVMNSQPCFICGEKAVAHHPDYSRQLDVVWLCPPHHRETHRIVKKQPNK